MGSDRYGTEIAVGEIELVKGEAVLLQRKLSATLNIEQYTYTRAKTLALENKLDEKVEILAGNDLRDVVCFVACSSCRRTISAGRV